MNLNFFTPLAVAGMWITIGLSIACAQSVHEEHGHNHAMPNQTAAISPVVTGPHGGTLRHSTGMQLETVVSHAGIQLFVFDATGSAISVNQGRGAASLRVEGNAKRYRYDLLPDGKGGLTAPVNLSKIAGRQIEINMQLVGLPGIGNQPLTLQEVVTVPLSEQQMATSAIARQKICPVSGKPLGSMGDPVAVKVNSQTVYACCDGCVAAIEADPARYAGGRPRITISTSTAADAPLIARQATCPVMDASLGSMGQPVKVMVGDKAIFLCCKGCVKKIQADPARYLAAVYGDSEQGAVPAGGTEVRPGIFRVSDVDAPFIAAQGKCPVMDEPLDAMGGPYKVNADGKAIYICCPGCAKKIAAEPQKYLTILAQQGVDAPAIQ